MVRGRSQEIGRRARQDAYRQLVLEAAEGVFARKGYDDTKMEEIAREAGLSLGTVYSVLEGKAEIFRAVHEFGDRALLERGIECARGIDDPAEVVLSGLRSMAEYFVEHPDFLRMHLRESLPWGMEAAGAGSRQRTEAWKEGMRMLTRSFERCIDEGLFHPGDARLLARMAVSMMQVALATWVEDGMQREAVAVVDEIQEQVRRSFARTVG